MKSRERRAVETCNKAIAAHSAGDFPKAELLYKRALELNHNHWPSLHNLGLLLSKWGRNMDAVVYFKSAVRLDKGVHSLFELGEHFRKMRVFDECVRCYIDVLKREGTHIGATNGLGICLITKGRIGEAIERFNAMLHWLRNGYPCTGNRQHQIAAGLNNLANCYLRRGEMAAVLDMHHQSLQYNMDPEVYANWVLNHLYLETLPV